MKKGGGKNKGSQWEREISKTLSLWISYDTNPHIFWRSASSGAKATINSKNKGKKDSMQCGDLAAVDPCGADFISKFYVELKFYKNLHMESLIYGTPAKNSILEFWTKAQEQAQEYNKIPLLIAKQNQHEIIVITNSVGRDLFWDWWGSPETYTLIPHLNLTLFDFKWIIDYCGPEVMK